MWVLWAIVIVAFSAWLGYTWLAALRVKYQHTLESGLVLCLIALMSLFLSWRMVLQVAPQWGLLPVFLLSIAVAFVLFSLLSFIAVNLWLGVLTRGYDDRIVALEEEEDRLLRRLEALRWKAVNVPSETEPDQKVAVRNALPNDEVATLKKIVLDWEQAGGAARVRSLKVLEWKDEIASKGDAELKADSERLRGVVEDESDEGKREQARARWALYKAESMARESRARRESTRQEVREDDKPRAGGDQMAMRQRLQDILKEMQVARAEKAEFLRNKIRLTWRRVQ